jgi:ParB family chromosome partitioning protein
MLEMSLVENIHRENLNPLEEAEAYHQLISKFRLTQDEAAGRVGKSRSAVANMLRLRQLPEQIKTGITEGVLTMGHARALLGAETVAIQVEAWKKVVAKGLSVRETENLIKQLNRKPEPPEKPSKSSEEIYFSGIEDDLSRHFGTRVRIKRRGRKGRVEVEFYSDEDLDRLIQLFKQEKDIGY